MQNARFTAFNFLELLRENHKADGRGMGGGGRGGRGVVKLPLPYPLRFGLKFVLIHLNLYYAIRPRCVNTPYFLCINLHPTYYKFDNIQCIRGNNTIEIKTFLVNYIYYVFT